MCLFNTFILHHSSIHQFHFFADMAIIVNELNTVNIINFIRISKSKEWCGLRP